MSLRPYQIESLDAIVQDYRNGVRRQLLALPTGCGKTVVFSNLPQTMRDDLGGQILVLAHREELLDQAAEKLRSWNPDLTISIEQADRFADPNADIVVASVATIGRANSKRRQRFNWDRIKICIVDECHHACAATYKRILEEGGFLEDGTDKLLLGCTATPNRSDGTPLAEIFEKIVFKYSLREAIQDGWLVDLVGIRVNTRTSLDSVHTLAGDFNQGELADEVNTPERNQLIVKSWMENAVDRQTIAFSVDVQHAVDLAEMFQGYGVRAEAVWGNDPDRAEKLRKHRSGETTLLANCGVLTEGYDDAAISCIVLARPTKSSLLFEQMIGRGTRILEGKKNCLVLDVVDNSTRHSLATLPSLMGMPTNLDLHGGSAIDALEQLEDAQRKFPNVDFSRLTDITKLQAFVQEVDLWREVKFAPEVEAHSKFAWHRSLDGGFVLLLPERQKISITQNILGKWELNGLLNGVTDSLEAAFHFADEHIQHNTKFAGMVLREAKWHGDPATPKQIETVRKLYRGKPVPENLSKGEAANLISAAIAQFRPRPQYS